MTSDLVYGDVIKWSAGYKGVKFHALISDPPYHLTSITHRFGRKNSAPAKYGSDGVFQRISRGFRGETWDGGDIAFDPDTWWAIKEVLLPGALGMAFSSSRGWHRLAVAIEDAGYIIHPSIFGWVYGSGFPHSARLDKRFGEQWNGYRYGTGALKPAIEPIIVFQKPYEGSRALHSISQTGAGAYNIDGTRIGAEDGFADQWDRFQSEHQDMYEELKPIDLNEYAPDGRWPANLIIAHHPDCAIVGYEKDTYGRNAFVDGAKPFGGGAGHDYSHEDINTTLPVWKCHPDCVAKKLNAQAGKDVARYYFQYSFNSEDGLSAYYESKAYTPERDAGLDKGEVNPHAAVKPIALTKYLAKMLLPPVAYAPRRILVPFAGVASEMIGASLAGWDEVVGVELNQTYCDIGRKRIARWESEKNKPRQLELFSEEEE